MPDWMTVRASSTFCGRSIRRWDAALEAQLLRDFALPLDRKLKHMSRGMRMKAAFISALSYRPALLVLDEPFSGLDPLVRDELIEGLLDRIGETTLFLSSHDLAEIESFASHVGYLEQGQLLFSEEMTTLSGRFRRWSFRSIRRAARRRAAEAWMEVERSGSLVRFTHSAFTSEGRRWRRLRKLFPRLRMRSSRRSRCGRSFWPTRAHRGLRTKTENGVSA
jgi:ABC-2 type transport system ATP-binding protein